MAAFTSDPAVFAAELPLLGRILALDYGRARIGTARSDPHRKLAFPLETYARRNVRQDIGYFSDYCRSEGISAIAIGMPYALSGEKTDLCEEAERFALKLVKKTPLPVLFCDERLTSVSAKRALAEVGRNRKGAPPLGDAIAASLILRHALHVI